MHNNDFDVAICSYPSCLACLPHNLLTCSLLNSLQIRNSIKGLFPNRDCFTLVRPCSNERDLSRLNRLTPQEALRPEFTEVGGIHREAGQGVTLDMI